MAGPDPLPLIWPLGVMRRCLGAGPPPPPPPPPPGPSGILAQGRPLESERFGLGTYHCLVFITMTPAPLRH